MFKLKLIPLILPLAMLIFNTPVFAQSDAKEIIAKAIEAHGGKEALVKAQQYKRTSSGTIFFGQTQTFTDELFVAFPNRIKLSIKLETKENILMGLEGDTGWSVASGVPIELSKEKVIELKEESSFLQTTSLTKLLDPSTKLIVLEETKVGGKAMLGIKATIAGGPEVSLYFDKETHMLAKAERKSKQSGVEILKGVVYLDYQLVGAVKFATRETHLLGGNKFVENKNITYTILDKVDASMFQKPGK